MSKLDNKHLNVMTTEANNQFTNAIDSLYHQTMGGERESAIKIFRAKLDKLDREGKLPDPELFELIVEGSEELEHKLSEAIGERLAQVSQEADEEAVKLKQKHSS